MVEECVDRFSQCRQHAQRLGVVRPREKRGDLAALCLEYLGQSPFRFLLEQDGVDRSLQPAVGLLGQNVRDALVRCRESGGLWQPPEFADRANARIEIECARLLTLKAAYMMDTVGVREAQPWISMIKVVAPNVGCQVLDWAIQLFGGAGVSDDFGLGWAYAITRTLRIADGPDEVHRNHIAKIEMASHLKR